MAFVTLCSKVDMCVADYSNEFELSYAKGIIDSDQHHKDHESARYAAQYRHYITDVNTYQDIPLESGFFARNSFIQLDWSSDDKTPKDDFKTLRLSFDKGGEEFKHRIRIAYLSSKHQTSIGDEYLNGGGVGVSVYLLETGRADFYSELQSGDGYRLSNSFINFRQVYTTYETNLVLDVRLLHQEKKSPYPTLGRDGSGFTANGWRGTLSWYFLRDLRFGVGHQSLSIDYRNKNVGARNALFLETEYAFNRVVSAWVRGGVAREIVERPALQEVQEDAAWGELTVRARF